MTLRHFCLLTFFFLFCLIDSNAQQLKTVNPYLKEPKGEAWLDLMTGKIYSADNLIKPSGPIVWGRLLNKQFVPSHLIDFVHVAAEPDPKYSPAWIDLRTGTIVREEKDSLPDAALRGRLDSKNYFHVYPSELKRWMSMRSPDSDAMKPLPVPGTTSASPMPMVSVAREAGFNVQLDRWWSEVKGPINTDPLRRALTARDLTAIGNSLSGQRIAWDPLAGSLELYWLDSEGNICHGDPGVSGQPGVERIIGAHIRDVWALAEQVIDEAQLLHLRNDTFVFPSYQATGPHIAQFSVVLTWIRQTDAVGDLGGMVVRTLVPIHSMPFHVALDSNIISPAVLHPSFDPNCDLSETGLPVPPAPDSLDEALGGAAPQHPTKCFRRNPVSPSTLIDACRAKTLRGGLGAGYYRWTSE